MHARYVVKDTFYKKAKKEGYRARSAYKLEEINERFRLIKKGDRVLDLGAAPGSWVQVESALVGPGGRVAGLDILPIEPVAAPNVLLMQADIREIDVGVLIREAGVAAFDVVTCDIAPNLSGIREVDDARVVELYRAVLRVVREALRPGGSFLIKLFASSEFGDMTKELKPMFARVTVFKPKSSRAVSAEMYVVCIGKK
jgi:23S rRNA (uridine2552-2'-O)-methyltransferase